VSCSKSEKGKGRRKTKRRWGGQGQGIFRGRRGKRRTGPRKKTFEKEVGVTKKKISKRNNENEKQALPGARGQKLGGKTPVKASWKKKEEGNGERKWGGSEGGEYGALKKGSEKNTAIKKPRERGKQRANLTLGEREKSGVGRKRQNHHVW